MEDTRQQTILITVIASLKQDLNDIKKRLDAKIPFLITEEAVEVFQEYIKLNTEPNTVRSFNTLLREFSATFPARNIAEIPPIHLQEFLARRWGSSEKATINQILARLRWFFTWAIKYCQSKGLPAFVNPCTFIEISGKTQVERPNFIPIERMTQFLATGKQEKHWLAFAILMTAGLRASELIGDTKAGKIPLKKKDVKGRVIYLHNTKSGAAEEIAIIPSWVADRLFLHLQKLGDDDIIFPMCYSTLYDVVNTHSKWVGYSFSPHYLRKWCASFWESQGEGACANFVLRHHPTLRDRYVALPIDMILTKQDEKMTPELFIGGTKP